VTLQMNEFVSLTRAKSGSGVRYISASKNYTYELWGKGNDMNLSTHDGGKEQTVLSSCKP
ncbi:MliC family protein, partial [Klebsiella pneumoniae]|uniref:MliC family protein n=1 Tax=Klebsiella pneumoniae TaxID=573 RepID=UPI0015F0353B